jgi:hypothetical protein
MGMSGQLHAPAVLLQEKTPVPIGLEGGSTPKSRLDAVTKRKISAPCREPCNPRKQSKSKK